MKSRVILLEEVGSIIDFIDEYNWVRLEEESFEIESDKLTKLDQNQKLVLDYLKEAYKNPKNADKSPYDIPLDLGETSFGDSVRLANGRVRRKGDFEVLKAFAEWGIEEEEKQ